MEMFLLFLALFEGNSMIFLFFALDEGNQRSPMDLLIKEPMVQSVDDNLAVSVNNI